MTIRSIKASPVFLSTLFATALGLHAGTARADTTTFFGWLKQTGCAHDIAVGPNDHPWIVDCRGPTFTGHASYLAMICNPLCHDQWFDDGFTSAVNIAVDLNGEPWVSDPDGVIYGDGQDLGWIRNHSFYCGADGYPPCPSSAILQPQGAGSWGAAGAGAVGPFVVSARQDYLTPNVNAEMWVNMPVVRGGFGMWGQNQFWGVGCGNQCNNVFPQVDLGLFTQRVEWGWSGQIDTGWQQLPGGAIGWALFTDPPSGFGISQNPWVLNHEDQIFVWTGAGWQVMPTPERVQSITDHFILGVSGTVYRWTGTASGQGNGTWNPVLHGSSNMWKITSSEAIGNTPAGTIGPSEIWGLDFYGSVYVARWQTIQTVK